MQVIAFSDGPFVQFMLVLTDLKGSVFLSQEHDEISNLDLSDLRNGVYILSVTNSNGKFAQKIVK